MKRLIAVTLALMLCLPISFAAESTKLDGQVKAVDSRGYTTVYKEIEVKLDFQAEYVKHNFILQNFPDGSVPPTEPYYWKSYLMALYDNNNNMVLDFTAEAPWHEAIEFVDDMAIIQTGSTSWEYDSRGYTHGNGKRGVINRSGKFVIPPKYISITEYLGNGKFSAVTVIDGYTAGVVLDVNDFIDMPSSWASIDITAAINVGLVPGSLQTAYTQASTRAEFCALAVALYEKVTGKVITERKTFIDSNYVNVEKAAAIGVVNGIGYNKFAPNDKLTREQAATMLARLAGAVGKTLPKQASAFADNASVSSWAFDSVGQVQATNIMNGVGNNTFAPKSPYTREQSIITMLRLYNLKDNTTPSSGSAGQLYPMTSLAGGSYLWGYMDGNGKFAIEPKYTYASEWNGEYGIVSLPEDSEQCFVIDRSGKRVVFEFYLKGTIDSFPLTFYDDLPNVYFAGNYLIVPEMVGDPYGGNSIFSLPDRKYFTSTGVQSFSEGMLSTWYRDNAGWIDQNGDGFSSYGQGGAFYDGVAVTWGRLINKKGETVYEYDFSKTPEISVYGMGSNTFVGDSCIFAKNKKSSRGYWELTEQYGVIRADGTVILPAEYSFVKLTPCKQILTGKKGQTYRLHDASGKEIYKFPTYMTGAFYYDGTGHYLFRTTDDNLVVLSVSGTVTAKIPVAKEARHDFVSGLVRVTEKDGHCKYYDVTGKAMFG